MNLILASLLAVVGSIPLLVLVTQAERRRKELEALQQRRAVGLISQQEFDRTRLEILNRSFWRT